MVPWSPRYFKDDKKTSFVLLRGSFPFIIYKTCCHLKFYLACSTTFALGGCCLSKTIRFSPQVPDPPYNLPNAPPVRLHTHNAYPEEAEKRGYRMFAHSITHGSRRQVADKSQANSLCGRCASVDFQKVFAGEYETPTPIVQLGHVSKGLQQSSCPLCRLVADMIFMMPSGYEGKDLSLPRGAGEGRYLLGALKNLEDTRTGSTDFDYQGRVWWEDVSVAHNMKLSGSAVNHESCSSEHCRTGPVRLALFKYVRSIEEAVCYSRHTANGEICLANTSSVVGQIQNSAVGRLVEPSCVDYRALSSWIRECEENHCECKVKVASPAVPGLRLIDCMTGLVTPAPEGTQYAALSYVWGDPNYQSHSSKRNMLTTRKKPLVVRDAMQVVMNLGYQYLWVDRSDLSPSKADSLYFCTLHTHGSGSGTVFLNLTIQSSMNNYRRWGQYTAMRSSPSSQARVKTPVLDCQGLA